MNKLISFYGDDFTGSADVMESLATHDVRTVLFTRLPTAQQALPFVDFEAIGLAGSSRSQTPDWMDEHLPPAFEWLRAQNSRFCHYKVCSTFDSSPTIGSIGRATEIGLRVFRQMRAALVIGAPQLKRYTFSGHLFAGYQGKTYRIDRHPVMSVHPVTPMGESDVLRHLALQTHAQVDLIDVHDLATQRSAGEALLNLPLDSLPFVVGSSGVEYALMSGLGKERSARFSPIVQAKQVIVVSGSVSPTTERQIAFATRQGFVPLQAEVLDLAVGNVRAILQLAAAILEQGKSPLIYSASGPSSDQGEALKSIPNGRETLSKSLGKIARHLVERFNVPRLIMAGGDTASHALGELDVHALTTRFPLIETPGSPLCRAYSDNAVFEGLEIAMKGGQVGGDDYFVKLRDGLK